MIRLAALDRKRLRDLRRLWAQALAIALVMAAGVATQVLGTGAVASLDRSRAACYEANRFADVFATVTRAPLGLLPRIEAIPGVLAAEGRIRRLAPLDLPDIAEPGTLLLVSAPPSDGLNRLHLREGRLPEPGRADEAVVSQGFAAAHALRPGATIHAVLGGRRHAIAVVGVAISPEFIYALGPGEMLPDPRRFGIAWMPRDALAPAWDMEGAFDDLVLRLAPGASEAAVIRRLDAILARYGGTGAAGRGDQMSHAFLDAELSQLRGTSRVLPPVFLLVAAFLVSMTLGRMVALEREQIGLLKALGYGPAAIVRHYLGFVLAIAVVGILLGWAAGAWMGAGLARLYARFFDFPVLVFSRSPAPYAWAALVTAGAGVAGAANAVRRVAWLPPAVAMAPPAPPLYRRWGTGPRLLRARQTGVMVARHLGRWPLRTGSGVLGLALAVAVLVGSLWSFGSIEAMIDLGFARLDRSDATLAFAGPLPRAALHEVARLPGVRRAEPFRAVPARLSHGARARRVALEGRPPGGTLAPLLDPAGTPFEPPATGLALSEALAGALGVGPGDRVRVELLDGRRRSFEAPVASLASSTVGLTAATTLAALDRMLREPPRASGARLLLDPAQAADLYAALEATPQAGALTLKHLAVRRFRETMAQNITIQMTVFLSLAGIIAFGVSYNFARISLSEQGRELASLRVLGFQAGEVAAILWAEIGAVVLMAQPLGWLLGAGFAHLIVRAFRSELYRVELVIRPEVYAWASLVVTAAAAASAGLLRARIARLDLIEVLKTRE